MDIQCSNRPEQALSPEPSDAAISSTGSRDVSIVCIGAARRRTPPARLTAGCGRFGAAGRFSVCLAVAHDVRTVRISGFSSMSGVRAIDTFNSRPGNRCPARIHGGRPRAPRRIDDFIAVYGSVEANHGAVRKHPARYEIERPGNIELLKRASERPKAAAD